jgi:hypothetical protein
MAARRGRKNTTWWEYPEVSAASSPSASPTNNTLGVPSGGTTPRPSDKKLATQSSSSPRPSAKAEPVLSFGNKPKTPTPTPTAAAAAAAKVATVAKKETPKHAAAPAKTAPIEDDDPPPPPPDEPPPPPEEEDDLPPPGALDVLSHMSNDHNALPRLTGPVTLDQTLSNIAIRSAFRIFLEVYPIKPTTFCYIVSI